MRDEDGECRRKFREHILSQDRTGGWYALLDEDGKRRFVLKLYASRDQYPNGISGEIAEVCGGAVVRRTREEFMSCRPWYLQLASRVGHAYRILRGGA